ncbi:MAG TPA: GAF domain-containing protein, partial [Anaerolineales bacterium]
MVTKTKKSGRTAAKVAAKTARKQPKTARAARGDTAVKAARVNGSRRGAVLKSAKVEETRRAKVQDALYKIAEAASAASDLQEFYASIHGIVGELMYARNFFIALYDETSGLVSWEYFVDEVDPTPLTQPLTNFHGATGWVLQHGKTIADTDGSWAAAKVRGEAKEVGTDSEGIAVPLKVEDKTIGVVLIQSYTKGIGYQPEDLRILEFVAQHIAVALTRARAIEETRQRNEELAIINAVQAALASKLDFQGIVDSVGNKLAEIFSEENVGIGFLDRASGMLKVPYLIENGRRIENVEFPIGEKGLVSHMFKTRQPLIINSDYERISAELGALDVSGEPDPRSWLGIPIIVHDEVIGAFSLQNWERENAYSASTVRLLQTLAGSLGVALENARLFDETERLLDETAQRAAELAIINSVQEGLARQLDFQGIIDLVGEKVGEIFAADTVAVGMYDAATDRAFNLYYVDRGQKIPLQDGPAPRPSLTAVLVDTRAPLLIGTSKESEKYGALRIPRAGETVDQNESFLGVPIMAGETVIGAVSVQSYKQNAYDAHDQDLLQTLAHAMSVALENARLFDELQNSNRDLTEALTQQTATGEILRVIAGS